MKRILVLATGIIAAVVLLAGPVAPADAAPERAAHVPISALAVCNWVLEANPSYGPTFNVDPYDLLMVHYGSYHIYNCAARYIYGSSSSYSLCFQYNYERGTTSWWGTRPRGQCS